MSSLPATWIVGGCLLLLLVAVMAVLLLMKSREVATLKKQCEELRDTMRMMRYEEANLARMLHTASKPVGLEAQQELEVEQEEEIEEEKHTVELPATSEEVEQSELSDFSESSEEPEVSYLSEIKEEIEDRISVEALTPTEPEQSSASLAHPQKQPINERRSAIPTDLFAAWFAENEETQEDACESSELQSVDKSEEIRDHHQLVVEPSPLTYVAEAPVVEEQQEIEETDNLSENVLSSQSSTLKVEDERFCRKLERIVATRLRNPNLNIDIIAAQFGIGRTNFYRKVRELMGMSPNDYLRKCRMERAAELLRSTEDPISEVCAQVGIPDAQYFSRVFKAYFGMTPSIYRENNNQ